MILLVQNFHPGSTHCMLLMKPLPRFNTLLKCPLLKEGWEGRIIPGVSAPPETPVTATYEFDRPVPTGGWYEFWMIDAYDGGGNSALSMAVVAGGQTINPARGGVQTEMTAVIQKSGGDEWTSLGVYSLPADQPLTVTLTGTTLAAPTVLGIDALVISAALQTGFEYTSGLYPVFF